jgi:ankyrin repeat protein
MPRVDELIEQAKQAFCKNDVAAVRELLERHPALKSRMNEPWGPFDSPPIVRARSREMLDVLLAAGADINAKSRWWAGGFGLLDSAEPELAAYAIERGAVVDVHAATRLGLFEKLKELVATNRELIHAPGGDGQTPLHFAGRIEIAEYLLSQGADIDARDIDHESTPAQYMVRDRQDVARYLVKRGCKTDLLMGAALGDLDLVRNHLEADPACIGMSVGDDHFPKRDPRAGGTIYIWTLGHHKTAPVVAREFGHEDVFRLLMDRSPETLKLALACELGDEAAFRALLAIRPNLVQTLSEQELRKLARAAENNNTEAVRLMVAAGWPVSACARHGATALHWACFHGNLEMANLILSYAPPLEIKDADFNATPFGWAMHGSEHGWHRQTGDYAGTVEALILAGAKVPEKISGSEAVQEALRRTV